MDIMDAGAIRGWRLPVTAFGRVDADIQRGFVFPPGRTAMALDELEREFSALRLRVEGIRGYL